MRVIAGDKFDVAVHHGRDECYVSGQPIQLGDDQAGTAATSASRQRLA
jgi:hypothetical protein